MDWKTRIPVLFLWVFVVLSSTGESNAEQRVVCYYTNWSVYRPGTAKFSPQNINPYLCTHLIYAFGGFTKDNTLKPFDKYQDIEKGGYAKFTGLKTYNKDLKTMLAIGGWNEGSSRFSPMVADAGKRKEFVRNSIKFLRQNHFDGLDLDWEYPAFRDGGKPRDRNNYADLVQELREEFEKESSKTGRSRLLLSMAMPAGIEYIDKGYDVPRLNAYLDFINLLSYDYHSAYEPAANHHSPLYPLEEDNEYNYDSELTIDYTINHLLKSGASTEKIVLGIPTYGRSYTLFNEDATDIGAPADGPGEEGDATREKGYLAYYEICESIAKSDDWQVVQPNPSAMGPYAYRGNQWVGYDDEDIVRAKARYVNEKKLGGIMFWSIDNDDFRGKCHGRPYPLIEAAKEALLAGDDRSNSVTKSRHTGDRKKTKTQGGQRIQPNTIGRKVKAGKRSTTTEATRRRISSTRSQRRSNGRINSRDNEDDDENVDDNEEEANSLKSVEKPRSRLRPKNTRSRNQSPAGGRKKQQNSRRNTEDKNDDESREEQRSKKITTPEPPTTPDPGTDFKCEDEGFFPHPRDCKKYFWCLDSGPSGLGIVGHQFTCPSGLVFNKAADSCDYPRNVVCPKTKVTQSTVTTTRAPITAATSRTTYLHKSTQRTTTANSESQEEYEYYDVDEDDDEDEGAQDSREAEEAIRSTTTSKPYKTINRSRPTTTTSVSSTTEASTAAYSTKSHITTTERVASYEDEEDPRVLKELIDLIKKAGGIEQLEKQLLYQEKNSAGNIETTEEHGKATPATISRSLYERVLNRQATRIAGGFLGSLSSTQSSTGDTADKSASKNSRISFVNGPGGAQFEGLDQVPEVKNLRRTNKHEYVTIERNRQSTSESPTDDEEEAVEEDDGDSRDVASSEDRAVSNPSEKKPSNRRFTPSYVNIRRPRPSATTENDVELKDDGKENGDDPEEDDVVSEEKEEPIIESHRVAKTEEKSPSPKSRYTNTQRFRSTTLRNSVDEETEQVKSASTTSTTTSTTTTTTERTTVPVTEEISDISSTPSTTLEPLLSTLEPLINLRSENITRAFESISDETSSTVKLEDKTKASNEVTLALVENSATEILFTTVPASSLSTGSNYDTFTREPSSPVVSQPRPFGFSRRGRPTTTSTTASPTASVTEQTRPKVDSETPKLPTLKELVGLTTTLSNGESTSQSTRSPMTSRVDDMTIAVNSLGDETNNRGYKSNQVDINDHAEGAKNSSDSDSPLSESAIDKEFIDNDILSSEEIQRRSSSASFVNVAENQIGRSTDDAEQTLKGDDRLRRVEVPVKILDDTNGEEIAELVLLRVPENKLNSALLQSVLRVKILERQNEKDRAGMKKTRVVKPENLPDSSVENELADSLRSGTNRRRKINNAVEESSGGPSTNPPRNRQRIVKARRRTRPTTAAIGDGPSSIILAAESTSVSAQVISKTSRRRENTEKSVAETTTIASEFLENVSTSVPRATTLRGNSSILLKFLNLTRGFYVTKNIDEVSLVPDVLSTSFVEPTRYSPVQSNDVIDDTTHEIDLTTLKIDSMNTIDTTTSTINIITQSDETITAAEETMYTAREKIATRESTSTIGSIISSLKDEKFTSDKLETLTPDHASTIKDQFDESGGSWTAKTEENVINESEITTLGSWRTEQTTTKNPMIPIESPTTEVLPADNPAIHDNHVVTKTTAMTKYVTESLKASHNNYGRSSIIMEKKDTIDPSNAVSALDDANSESPRLRFDVTSTTGSIKIASNEDNVETTSEPREYQATRTTAPMTTAFTMNDAATASQTEKSSRGMTTNPDVNVMMHGEVSHRGGIRYTTSAKSTQPIQSSSKSGDHSRITTRWYEVEVPRNNVTGEKVSPAPSAGLTHFNDETIKSTANGESTRINSEPEKRTTSLYRGSRPLAKSRKNARKTTKSPETTKTESTRLDQKDGSTTVVTTTERYVKVETTLSEESPYSTMNTRQETVDYAQNSPSSVKDRYDTPTTTSSFHNHKIGSDSPPNRRLTLVSSSLTESYVPTAKSTASVGATYLMTNFEAETAKRSENPLSPSKDYDWTQATTRSSETDGRSTKSDGSTLPTTNPITTEAYERTSLSEYVPFTAENFEESDLPHSRPSFTRSQEVHESKMNASTQQLLSSTTETTEPTDKMLQLQTTAPADYSTNFLEFTESSSASAQNVDSNLGVTRSLKTSDPSRNFKMTNEISATISTAREIDGETTNTMAAQIDELTTYSIQDNNNGFYGTTVSDKTDIFPTVESDDKITETIDTVNIFVPNEVAISEENRTESSNMQDTTTGYSVSSVPWLYHRNLMIDHRKTEYPIAANDTMDIESPISASTTASYDEAIVHTDDIYTTLNDQTMPETSEGFTKTTSSEVENNSLPTEPNEIVTTTSFPNTIAGKSPDTTIGIGLTDKKIDSSAKEFFSQSDASLDLRRSMTTIHEESTYSTAISSLNSQIPVTERQPKRTRGKVRFTKLAGSSNDSTEQTRRPIKQVVVRRRLTNTDRDRKPTTPQANVAKPLSSVSRRNQNPNTVQIQNRRTEHQNLDDQSINDRDEKHESRTNEVTRLDNKSNDRSSKEKPNLRKPTRRRVIVYRGRPRPEKTATTPKSTTTTTTKASTTTVQSPSHIGDEIAENTKIRRRKWRKRVVLKRSRIDFEADDQSIAETGDISRVLTDDEHVKDFRNDELGSSYIDVPHENEKSSKPEDFRGEVNLFKNSGPFLRRPGTLIRNDASNRSRSKVFNASVPPASSTSRVSPLSSIQSVDPGYETKTYDQSLRAQELTVTLSDPPAFGSSTTTGRLGLRKQAGTTRKISTTIAPRAEATTTPRSAPIVRRRQNKRTRNDKSRNLETLARPRRPAIIDYDYYVDDEIRLVLKPELKDKLFVTKKGGIRCLDQGNFAHPTSCKKFITCARMVNGQVIGTEYTCPDKLSFDPVGGICNWSAGLGCEEKSKSSD